MRLFIDMYSFFTAHFYHSISSKRIENIYSHVKQICFKDILNIHLYYIVVRIMYKTIVTVFVEAEKPEK